MEVYVPEKVSLPLTACNRVAGIKLNIKTLTYKLQAMHNGQDFCNLENDQTIRFKSYTVKPYFMAQLLLIHKKMVSVRRVVILVYNPHLVKVTVPAGVLSSTAENMEACTSAGVIVVPGEDYDISTTPSTQGIYWDSKELDSTFTFVNMDRELIGDEVMIAANIRVNFGAIDDHYTRTGDDEQQYQRGRGNELSGQYSGERTTSTTFPTTEVVFTGSTGNNLYSIRDEPQPIDGG
jgi:hypothetical protein